MKSRIMSPAMGRVSTARVLPSGTSLFVHREAADLRFIRGARRLRKAVGGGLRQAPDMTSSR